MNLQHISLTIGLITSSAIALTTSPVHAFNFNTKTNLGTCGVLVDFVSPIKASPAILDPTLIKTCTTNDGMTLTAAANGKLQGKEVNKYTGVGITTNGQVSRGEIQKGETLNIALKVPSILQSLDLSFLYLPPVFGDKVFEKALITANGSVTKLFKVTGATSAAWSLGGTVTNLSPSTNTGGGLYRINNPFGNLLISSLSFTAPSEGFSAPNDSDYALAGIEIAYVPEPTTLLGLGVVSGLMATRRRRPKFAP